MPETASETVVGMTALAGKVAIVTGGSRGIGAAAARALAGAGASVMILARDGEAAAKIADTINDKVGQACGMSYDGRVNGGTPSGRNHYQSNSIHIRYCR